MTGRELFADRYRASKRVVITLGAGSVGFIHNPTHRSTRNERRECAPSMSGQDQVSDQSFDALYLPFAIHRTKL